MQENKRKFPLNAWEIAVLVILLPVIFILAVRFLIWPLNEGCPSPPVFFGIVLVVDAIWFLSMYVPTHKYRTLKMIITALLLTLSAAVVACWMLLYSWRDMW
jgi:hypothetical protein